MLTRTCTCAQTTLDSFASAVLGKHYLAEAWICPESSDAEMLKNTPECTMVMHGGELVWACVVLPNEPSPPAPWQKVASYKAEPSSDSLFDRVKAVLNKGLKVEMPRELTGDSWYMESLDQTSYDD